MHETDRFDVAERVAASREALADKLSELSRRVDSFREHVRPRELAKKKWVIAAAGVAGFVVGMALRGPRTPRARAQPGIMSSVVREILMVAAGIATRRYLGTGHAPVSRP